MSCLWKLLRIFRICMRLRSRKSPLHSDFQPASTYSYKDIKRKKQEKTFGWGCLVVLLFSCLVVCYLNRVEWCQLDNQTTKQPNNKKVFFFCFLQDRQPLCFSAQLTGHPIYLVLGFWLYGFKVIRLCGIYRNLRKSEATIQP